MQTAQNRLLVTLPSWITPYGLFLVAGAAGAWWLSRRGAKRTGLDPS